MVASVGLWLVVIVVNGGVTKRELFCVSCWPIESNRFYSNNRACYIVSTVIYSVRHGSGGTAREMTKSRPARE
jgi:hypothetical protein